MGRLHPLIVHLPIGFLLLAALLNVLSYRKRYAQLQHAVPLILLLGFISAALSCITGLLLAGSGDYDTDQLANHRLAGIILAVASGSIYFLHKKIGTRALTVSLLALTILLTYTGDLGGGLTHGSGYLSLATLTQGERKLPDNPDDVLVFEDIVHPILEKKCAQCHQGGKIKGNLSVQTWESLLKGGKHGPAITPGKLKESELYKRVTLNPADEKFMPSDGKPPLTRTELAVITWWIEKADAAVGKKLKDCKDRDAIRPQIASLLGKSSTTASLSKDPATADPADTSGPPPQHINPEIPATVAVSLIDNLRKKGWMVRVMLQKPVMLDLTLPAGAAKRSIQQDLTGMEKNIIWLNLSGNNFTDTDLAFLKQLSNLEKLRLEKNPLTDAIADDLTGLHHLEAVNLNETKLTGNGLDRLRTNPSIKRIYTWHTAVKEP
ncbi:MAG TPA: c-type cytochrome domain-containing protein [Puia sp.]|nr:c-type cytochrome domain-containing protein [Puia sp.]